ncbi:hypothetical protein [Lichenibacterium dinghuense]|uniref:hypothetical protein n=1 Tax=Lichenibacterium dinghuense TaxID=2895977 RepID=UPI001F380038|nr:hypothetical protein [Lichenibacterium sp. 6Y81]
MTIVENFNTPLHHLAALMEKDFPGEPAPRSTTVFDALLALETAQIFKVEAEFCFERAIRAVVDAENRLEFAKKASASNNV